MHRKTRKSNKPVEIPMTPMIDVVFQLLIYFIVTLQPMDVVAHMDVNRPAQQREAKHHRIEILRLAVLTDGYTLNDRRLDKHSMERILKHLADLNDKQTVLILVQGRAEHHRLVQALNICHKVGLHNLSVVSSRG